MLRKIFFSIFILLVSFPCFSSKNNDIHVLKKSCIKSVGKNKFKTCNEIVIAIGATHYIIPANFETDLISAPALLKPIIESTYPKGITPAIVHDWFYRKTCDFNRKQTDLIFYYMLRNDGISTIKASMMYYAVRLFGKKYYNEDYCE